jgi:hypothetical protein
MEGNFTYGRTSKIMETLVPFKYIWENFSFGHYLKYNVFDDQ